MSNYQNDFQFSLNRSKQRLKKANCILGQAVINKIISFALYLLGANIQALADYLKTPRDTVKSFIERITNEGLSAIEDRRQAKTPSVKKSTIKKTKLSGDKESITILFENEGEIRIPRNNKLQCRTILLSLLASGFLKAEEVADALQLSLDRTRKLKTALFKDDVQAVMDKRQGQQQDYRMTPEVKCELVQQLVLNINKKTSTSSINIQNDLNKRCNLDLSTRTIRLYVNKLGLNNLKSSLPSLLYGEKKT